MTKQHFALLLFPFLLALSPVAKAVPFESLADSLPAGAIAYVEFSDLGHIVRSIETSDALRWILSTEEYQAYQKSPNFGKAKAVKTIVEIILGSSLWDAAGNLLDGRIALALYPNPSDEKKPHTIAIVRTDDSKTRTRLRALLKPLLVLFSKPADTSALCVDTKTWGEDDKGFVSMHDDWLVATPQRELLDRTLGLLGDTKKTPSISAQDGFVEMERGLGVEHHMRAYVNTAMISKAAGPRFGMPQKFEEGMASFLFGGLVELAGMSPFAGATLDINGKDFHLTTAIAGDPKSLPAPYGLYFTDHPKNGVIDIPQTEGTIAGFTIHRKLGEWYRHRDELLAERLLPGFDKFETDIGNLLPQKDFGQDVLPLIGDNFTILAAHQKYDHLEGEPGIKLPAFAVIFDLADPEKGSDIFQLFVQTLSSVINFQAGQEGRQPWVLDMDMHNETKITWSRYMEKPEGERLPIVFNFQPAAASVGRKYIIATSVQYCKDLIDHFKKPESFQWHNRNADFQLDIEQLTNLAELNEGFLRSQEIQKGTPPEVASKRVKMLMTVMRQFNDLRFHSASGDGIFKMNLEGSWK